MGRPKSRRNRGLPEYLTYDPASGLYRYQNPITKRRTWLNRDRHECITTAKYLNARLIPTNNDLAKRVVGDGNHTWRQMVDRYLTDVFAHEDLAAKTRRQYTAYYHKIRGCDLADMHLADIRVVHVSDALDNLTAGKRMRNVYRNRMSQVFKYGVQVGWCEDDVAIVTAIIWSG